MRNRLSTAKSQKLVYVHFNLRLSAKMTDPFNIATLSSMLGELDDDEEEPDNAVENGEVGMIEIDQDDQMHETDEDELSESDLDEESEEDDFSNESE